MFKIDVNHQNLLYLHKYAMILPGKTKNVLIGKLADSLKRSTRMFMMIFLRDGKLNFHFYSLMLSVLTMNLLLLYNENLILKPEVLPS